MSSRFIQLASSLALAASLLACTAHAQRGGGPPGGGGPGGGGPGGPGSGGPDNRMGGNAGPGFGGAAVRGGGSRIEPGSRNSHQMGLPGRWWDDRHFAHNINIRADQQHKMDDIFEANKGQLVTAYSNLQREEQNLSTMKSQDLKDESKVFASIDRVAQARADLEKESAHISMQLRQQLDADQLARLDKEIASTH